MKKGIEVAGNIKSNLQRISEKIIAGDLDLRASKNENQTGGEYRISDMIRTTITVQYVLQLKEVMDILTVLSHPNQGQQLKLIRIKNKLKT